MIIVSQYSVAIFIRMTTRPKSELSMVSSRKWSCDTLNDGVDMLLSEAERVEAEAEALEKQIQDRIHMFNSSCFC